MDLIDNKKKVLDKLVSLIQSGSDIRDTITAEYRDGRVRGTFDPNKDIATWQDKYGKWWSDCMNGLEQLFEPAIIVLNRFKNPPMDGLYPDGENFKWAGLMKNINARLELLGDLYEAVSGVPDEQLSDYFELSVPIPTPIGIAKIKVDKIISKLLRR